MSELFNFEKELDTKSLSEISIIFKNTDIFKLTLKYIECYQRTKNKLYLCNAIETFQLIRLSESSELDSIDKEDYYEIMYIIAICSMEIDTDKSIEVSIEFEKKLSDNQKYIDINKLNFLQYLLLIKLYKYIKNINTEDILDIIDTKETSYINIKNVIIELCKGMLSKNLSKIKKMYICDIYWDIMGKNKYDEEYLKFLYDNLYKAEDKKEHFESLLNALHEVDPNENVQQEF